MTRHDYPLSPDLTYNQAITYTSNRKYAIIPSGSYILMCLFKSILSYVDDTRVAYAINIIAYQLPKPAEKESNSRNPISRLAQ